MQTPWKVILAFVGVFIAGAVFGGLLALRVGREIIRNRPAVIAPSLGRGDRPMGGEAGGPALANSPAGPQAVQRAMLMRRLAGQLDLSPAQRERVGPVITRGLQDFWREQQRFSRENVILLQRLKQDIGRELTPDQQKRLDEMWQKQSEILRRRQQEAQAQRPANGRPGAGAKAAPTDPAKPASDSPAKPAAGTGK